MGKNYVMLKKANLWPSDYGESLFILVSLLIYFHKFGLNEKL